VCVGVTPVARVTADSTEQIPPSRHNAYVHIYSFSIRQEGLGAENTF
jgi:hypothetical protein